MAAPRTDGRLLALGTAAVAPLVWGTTYSVTTELLPAGRPLLAGALRALPAGLVLLAIGRRLPTGAWWWRSAVLGTLNIGAFFALLFVAAGRLDGGVAAALGAVQPLIAAGLAAVLLAEPLRRPSVVAGLLGVLGVALIVLQPGADLDALGVAAGIAGAASMATGVTLTKRWQPDVPLLAFTSWQLLAGGALLVVLTAAIEGPAPSLTAANVAGFAWISLVGTALAYACWFRGISRLPVANVSLLALLAPLVAGTIGYLWLGQTLGPLQLAGAAVVLGAQWIGQRAPAGVPAVVSARAPSPGTAGGGAWTGCPAPAPAAPVRR